MGHADNQWWLDGNQAKSSLLMAGGTILAGVVAAKLVSSVFSSKPTAPPVPSVPQKLHPLFGSIPWVSKYMKSPSDHIDIPCMAAMKETALKVFRMSFVVFQWTMVCDASASKEVLVTKNYPKSPTYGKLMPMLGYNTMVAKEGEEWSRLRKAFAPGFTPQYLKSLVPMFVERCQLLMTRFDSAVDSGEAVPVHKELVKLTFDVICQAFLSADMGIMTQPEPTRLYTSFLELMKVTFETAEPDIKYMMRILPWIALRLRRLRNNVLEPLRPIVQEHMDAAQRYQAGDTTRQRARPDMLDIALRVCQQEGTAVSETDILDQATSFLFAGHDTTASSIAFTIYEVAKNPDIEKAVLEELDRVLAGRLPTADDLNQLKYLNALYKESLRIWPPGASARKAPKGSTLAGLDIGGQLLYCPHTPIHRDPDLWGPDAEVFRPERWLDEAYVSALHPFAYMPFSKGPRDCLGQNFATMEAKVVLAMLFQRYHFQYMGDGPEELGSQFTAYPKKGVPVRISKRAAA